MTFIVMPSLPI